MQTGEHDSRLFAEIWRHASQRYAGTGTVSRQFAAGKLKGDPIYRELCIGGVLRPGRLLVDVGCGQGLTLAGLAECRRAARDGWWTATSPAPVFERMVGIELRPRIAEIARQALGADAEILAGDAAALMPPRASTILLLDVLHLMPLAAQEAVITRAAAAIADGGVLILREADAAAGGRFLAVRIGNWLKALAVGNFRQMFHFRTASQWRERLANEGLQVQVQPMGAGTPFGNVLLVARPRDEKIVSCEL
jgi:SAM-dependent methyltransferase